MDESIEIAVYQLEEFREHYPREYFTVYGRQLRHDQRKVTVFSGRLKLFPDAYPLWVVDFIYIVCCSTYLACK